MTMTMISKDGRERRQLLVPIKAVAKLAWKDQKLVRYSVEPTTLETAVAHLHLHPEDGVVVITRRGPKGGWNELRYLTLTDSPWSIVRRRVREGHTLHLGHVEGNMYKTDGWVLA